jgi:anti-anti-sigma regulatory factor
MSHHVNSAPATTWLRYTCVGIAVTRRATTITVRGRVVCGVRSADFLLEAVRRAAGRDTRVISIDLRNVYKIDAAGIGVLAFAYSIATSAGIRLQLEHTPHFIVGLLKVCHLDGLLLPPPPADEKEMYETAA